MTWSTPSIHHSLIGNEDIICHTTLFWVCSSPLFQHINDKTRVTYLARKATQWDDEDFFDVTLVCDDDRIQARIIIMDLCSSHIKHV